MARFRLSRPAQADLASVLAASAKQWGSEGKRRYAALLAAAMNKVAADPEGLTTRSRPELAPGIRSLHIRNARGEEPQGKVRKPVHVLYYRVLNLGLIEIVRVLHERMEPSRHIGLETDEE